MRWKSEGESGEERPANWVSAPLDSGCSRAQGSATAREETSLSCKPDRQGHIQAVTRRRNIFIVVAFILAVFAVPTILHYRAKGRLEAYKQQLIAAGEKLTIAELIPQRPSGENGTKTFWPAAARAGRFSDLCPSGVRMIQPGKAQAGWQRKEAIEEIVILKITTNLWPGLANEIARNTSQLTEMRVALHQPAFYFSMDYQQASGINLSHLSAIKHAETEFYATMLFQLHEGQTNEAFENLLAAIVLPRVFNDEPVWISQLIRYSDVSIAFNATWAALQYEGWTDAQLAELQNEWGAIEIIPAAISAAAMERAMWPKLYEQGRISHPRDWPTPAGTNSLLDLKEVGDAIMVDPAAGWQAFLDRYPRYWVWAWIWSYDDERQMMQYWQDAINGLKVGYYKKPDPTKDQDAELDGPKFLLSKSEKGIIQRFAVKVFQPMTQAQTVMAVIALKRYQKREGKYPTALRDLVPEFLKKVPVDYMDGKDLRYRLKPDGTFLLYSVGQNGTDEGGDPTPLPNRSPAYLSGLDWVWPQVATEAEVKEFEDKEAEKKRR